MDSERDDRERPEWSPYLAGALTGLLVVVSASMTGNFFGASTSFVRTVGMIEKLFAAERVAAMSYFTRYLPLVDWQWLFLAGLLAGSAVSSVTSRSFRWQAVPSMWSARFGPNPLARAAVAFAGGAVTMFGARIAGG